MVKKEAIVAKLEAKLVELEKEFLDSKAEEVKEARNAIVKVLKENETSLPAAMFALEIVKWELLRGQYEEFLGHVKLTEKLPLKE
jgi:vacuolar-type H+-ATPase subunit H